MSTPPTRRFGPDGPEGRRWWEDGPDGGSGHPSGPPGPPASPRPPQAPRTARHGPPGWQVPPQPPPPRTPPPTGGPPRRPRPSRRPRVPGPGSVLGALVVAAIAVVVLFPEVLGLGDRSPFVQVVAFRPQLAVAAVAVAALGALGSWTRRAGPDGLVVALALGLVGVIALADVGGRAAGSADAVGTGGSPGDGLVVLSLNTYKGQADPDALADLVRSRSPDLVALPEARGDLRRRLASRLDDDQGGSGYRSYSADDSDDASGMTVFVRSSLGRPTVTQDRSGTYPSIVVDLPKSAPGVASGLRFVAVHPRSPRPGGTGSWARDVAGLSRWCEAGRPTIVAGDMNSTEDHQAFRDATSGCVDAGSTTGDGLTGTWPSWLPAFLGAQIDHVLSTDGPRPTAFEVVPAAGTDHRAVLARVGEG